MTEFRAARLAYWLVTNLLTESQLDVVYRGKSLRHWVKELRETAGLGVW